MNRIRRLIHRHHRFLHRHRWVSFDISSKVANTTHSFTIVRCWCGAYGTDRGE